MGVLSIFFRQYYPLINTETVLFKQLMAPYRVELHERINKLFEARGILNDYENKQLNLERYKSMLESVRKGTCK